MTLREIENYRTYNFKEPDKMFVLCKHIELSGRIDDEYGSNSEFVQTLKIKCKMCKKDTLLHIAVN